MLTPISVVTRPGHRQDQGNQHASPTMMFMRICVEQSDAKDGSLQAIDLKLYLCKNAVQVMQDKGM